MAERNTLEKLDVGALSPEQQEKLHQFKVFHFLLLKVINEILLALDEDLLINLETLKNSSLNL